MSHVVMLLLEAHSASVNFTRAAACSLYGDKLATLDAACIMFLVEARS
jgi:hypothetical protein